jgi:DNA (cytosine-5)-methyltransferase 1
VKPRLLDLFCGAGGCTKGYQRAGFYVVGVDIEPQPNYCGDEFVQGDALEVLETWLSFGMDEERWFDAIHASPPCQAYSTMRAMPNAGQHPDLVEPTRTLVRTTGLPYVIENVVGAPLHEPVTICGAALGLSTTTHDLARHRLFECSFPVMVPPCAHGGRPVVGFYGDHVRDARRLPGEKDRRLPDMAVRRAEKLEWVERAMGIDWMTWSEAVNAIPPAYTEHIGHYLMAEINARQAA